MLARCLVGRLVGRLHGWLVSRWVVRLTVLTASALVLWKVLMIRRKTRSAKARLTAFKICTAPTVSTSGKDGQEPCSTQTKFNERTEKRTFDSKETVYWDFFGARHVGSVKWGENCWRGVHILFAHFSFFGRCSVPQQHWSCRSKRFFDWEDFDHVTLLFLLGRDGPLFWLFLSLCGVLHQF